MAGRTAKMLAWARNAADVRKVDEGFLAAREGMSPLELHGVNLSLHHIHVGPGVFPRGKPANWHRHDQIQIEFVFEGRILFESKTTRLELVPGHGLITAPQVMHRWDPRTNVVMLGALVEVSGPRNSDFLSLVAQHCGASLVHLRDPSLLPTISQAIDSFLSDSPWAEEVGINLVSIWLAHCLKEALPLAEWSPTETGGPPARTESRGRFLCTQAREFMEANYGQPLQLTDVAVQLGISPRHLNRLFVKHEGKSVTSTLQEIRLGRAKRLLEKDPSISVKEVSFATGFSRPSYFTHCFKKAFGRRPGDVTATGRK